MRFSARLAGFCRSRWHQRRARRAEKDSFSVFVSNLDFRVPSLRQMGRTGADRGPYDSGKEAIREAQNRGRGYRSVARLARSGPGAALAYWISILPQARIQGLRPGAWHPVSGRCFPVRGNPNCLPQYHPSRALVLPRSNRRGFPQPPRGQPLAFRTIGRRFGNGCKSEPPHVHKTPVASLGRPARSSRAWQL